MDGDLSCSKKAEYDEFVATIKCKIDGLVIILNQKLKLTTFPDSSSPTGRKTDQTYLKKIDSPEFKGDIVEYPDFVR